MTEERLFELGKSLAAYLINNGILKSEQNEHIMLESQLTSNTVDDN